MSYRKKKEARNKKEGKLWRRGISIWILRRIYVKVRSIFCVNEGLRNELVSGVYLSDSGNLFPSFYVVFILVPLYCHTTRTLYRPWSHVQSLYQNSMTFCNASWFDQLSIALFGPLVKLIVFVCSIRPLSLFSARRGTRFGFVPSFAVLEASFFWRSRERRDRVSNIEVHSL